MLNVIIFGSPGCGKGTQSALIIEKYGLRHISTGEILREEMRKQTELGKEAARHIEKGYLVPDALIIRILADILAEEPNPKGYLFDGFPRTLTQGEELDKMLQEKGTPIATVLNLDVNEEELVQRLIKRGVECGRSDDMESVIYNRLAVYRNQTDPLREYYKKQGKLFTIKGSGEVSDVFERVSDVLDRLIL